MKIAISVLMTLLLPAPGWSQESAMAKNPTVRVDTSVGAFVLELDASHAPDTVENFLTYVDEGFYEGTVFHRVIPDFMAQGGGYTAEFEAKPTREPVRNESRNGLSNARGTVAMARTGDPHSATAQFFINLVDNPRLDGSEETWGYTVFGKVIEGMDVVDNLAKIPTGPRAPFRRDVPQSTILIERMEVEAEAAPADQ